MSKKYKKALILLFITVLPITIFGQGGINSPYSMMGIGDLTGKDFGRNIAMGNVMSPLISPVQLNAENPASYSLLSLNTFIFEFGMNTKFYQLNNDKNKFSNVTGNISYIAAGFPITKWLKTGVGLKPISSVGYQINELEEINSDYSVHTNYKGKGGVNSFYMDNSVAITKDISLGLKLSYIFGTLDKDKQVISNHAKGSKSASVISEFNHANFDAVAVGFGAHLHKSISSNVILNVGASYNTKTKLDGSYDRLAVLLVEKLNEESFVDTITHLYKNNEILSLPMSYSVGASVVLNEKLELAADYKIEDWTDCEMFGKNQNFNKNEQYNFGLEYIPSINSTKFLNVVKYRAGFSFNNSYLNVQNKQLKQFTASLGFGLPLRRFAIVNLSGSYSRRYVPGLDIIKEDIFQIHLNFSFKGTWFIKSKFY